MPINVAAEIDPATTAVVALEVQENLLLEDSALIPGLAAHATSIGLIDRLATLLAAARRVGAPVLYVIDTRRPDGIGAAGNERVGRALTGPGRGSTTSATHGPIVAELAPEAEDIVIGRSHGMTGFFTTPLDIYLRNLGITTVILVGVSANIAVNGTAIEAMNLGYRVVVPSDGIAGDPPEYVEQLLRYTIRNVALVTTIETIVGHWASLPAGS
jgi:nicotinamidase-related amidase